MPIDHSIYFNQQAPDIMGGVERGLKMSDMLSERNKKRGIDDAYKNSIKTNPDGTTSVDRNSLLTGLSKVDGRAFIEAQQGFKAQDAADAKMKIEKQNRDMDLISRVGPGIKDQQSYEQGLSYLGQQGVDISKMPRAYDPNLVNRYVMAGQSWKDQQDAKFKQQELDLKRQELGGKKSKENMGAVSDLRKERSSLPTTKATMDVSAAYNKIQAAAKSTTPAADMSLVFNYMKMLDPGSTVREGEYANARNTTGIPDKILNAYNQARKGNLLNPTQRSEFVAEAGGLYEAQMDIQNQVDSQYRAFAERMGVDPKDVILNFEANDPKSKKIGMTMANQKGGGVSLIPSAQASGQPDPIAQQWGEAHGLDPSLSAIIMQNRKSGLKNGQ